MCSILKATLSFAVIILVSSMLFPGVVIGQGNSTTTAVTTLPTLPTIPTPNITINGSPCTVTVNALVAIPAVVADGLCYDDKIVDRICCKNLVVLGGNGMGLVSIVETCPIIQYCCILKADVDKFPGAITVLC